MRDWFSAFTVPQCKCIVVFRRRYKIESACGGVMSVISSQEPRDIVSLLFRLEVFQPGRGNTAKKDCVRISWRGRPQPGLHHHNKFSAPPSTPQHCATLHGSAARSEAVQSEHYHAITLSTVKHYNHGAPAQCTAGVSKESRASPTRYKRQECEKQSWIRIAFETQEGPSSGQGVACACEVAEGASEQANCDAPHRQR